MRAFVRIFIGISIALVIFVIYITRDGDTYTPTGIGNSAYGFRMVDFTSQIGPGGSYTIVGNASGNALGIDTSFGTSSNPGTATTVGTAQVQLGQDFIEGVADPEVKKYSGEILYIDNRAAIQRSATQKEDVKIVLEF